MSDVILGQPGPSRTRGSQVDLGAAAWRVVMLLLNILVWVEVFGLAHLLLGA